MANVLVPTPLRKFTFNNATIALEGETVLQVFENLVSLYPDLKQYLLDGSDIKGFVKVYLGDEDIKYLKGPSTAVKETDVLSIIPAIAGGIR
jgi:molybdopterin converting factor small subunit